MLTHTIAPILITGVGRRLGAALAAYYQQQGVAVIGSYRRETIEIDRLNRLGVQLICADLSDQAGVMALVDAVKAQTDVLRAIIHNASVWYDDAYLMQYPDALAATWALHVTSPLMLNQQLTPLLMNRTGLRDIVFIGDASSQQGKVGRALYSASKAAMESLMRSQARALAPDIKVNLLAPGLLAFHETDTPVYRQQRLSEQLLGIEPGFQPAIDAITYLLNSPYTTASCLRLDGGAYLCV